MQIELINNCVPQIYQINVSIIMILDIDVAYFYNKSATQNYLINY